MTHGLKIPISPERLQNDLIDALEEGFRKKWEAGELDQQFMDLLADFLRAPVVQDRLAQRHWQRLMDDLGRAMFRHPRDRA